MRLSHTAINTVRGLMPGIIPKLRIALEVDSDSTIYKYVKDNSDNLTKAAALKVIREETGLPDAQLLTESKVPA